jgi:hypothetical protein
MSQNILIYIAGPLFSEADAFRRLLEGSYLSYVLEVNKIDAHACLFNPVNAPFNEKSSMPTSEQIFQGDHQRIQQSSVLFFDLSSNLDTGTAHELGAALEMRPRKSIYPIISDIRLGGKIDQGHRSAVGFNQYVTGSLWHHQYTLFSSFKHALEAFCQDFSLTLEWEKVENYFDTQGIRLVREKMKALFGA